MSNRIRRSAVAGAVAATLGALPAGAALADVPNVATDIAPVHGLVARVMDGLGTPDLVVRPGASPHGYAMRPSEARALAEADVVFWVGPELEPWLAESISSLAGDAVQVELLDAPGTERLAFREGATFEPHDHGDEGHDHAAEEHGHDHMAEEHGHEHAEAEHDHASEADAHEDHGHAADHEAHEEDHGHAAEHRHSHEGIDPHAWLDPENGKAWLDAIAAELARLDPGNAGAYRANAEAGKTEIDATTDELRSQLAPVQDMKFVVFHDAYQYFETRFDIHAAGAVSIGDASDPGPARIEEIREKVQELGVTCVFSEPQFNQAIVNTVLDGTGGHSGVIDPLGTGLSTGAGFYPALLREVAAELVACGQ